MDETSKLDVAIAVPKNSEFRDLFNYELVKLRQSGVLDKMLQVHIPDKTASEANDEEAETEVNGLDYMTLLFPFMVLVLGLLVAVGLAILENLVSGGRGRKGANWKGS